VLRQLKITIPNGDTTLEFDSEKELYIADVVELVEHFSELPGNFAYWNMLKVQRTQELESLEGEFKVWKAQQKSALQGTYKSETAKEEAIIVANSIEYLEKTKKMADVQYIVNILGVIVEAWKAKKDMLISLGAHIRAEMGLSGGLSIAEANAKISKNLDK
jgi:hypothetical protein